MRIIILSPTFNTFVSPAEKARLRRAGHVTVYDTPTPISTLKALMTGTEPRVIALDPDFCNWKAPPELFSRVPSLKAICLQTTSFSWINTEMAKMCGIPVTNLRHWSTESVAEWVIMMTCNLARKVPLIAKAHRRGDFSTQQGIELAGKTIGVVGLGHIGKRVAELANGMGMNVQYWSVHSRDRRFHYVPLPFLMRTSDIIVPAVAQNSQTKGLLTDQLLRTMKPNAMFVSVVHTMYSHELLLKMVARNKLYGYAFEETEDRQGKRFYKGNVLALPANAWVTKEAQQKNMEQWVQTIVDAAKGKFPQRVN